MKAAYPIDSFRMSADATKPGDRLFYGDIRSKNHILVFRVHVGTCSALPRPEEMASREECSYFDEGFCPAATDANMFFFWWSRSARRTSNEAWLVATLDWPRRVSAHVYS